MNLATLILVAVAIPFTVLALFWLIAQAAGWAAAHPRHQAILFMILGAVYFASFLAGLAEEETRILGSALQAAIGIGSFAVGALELRRQRRGESAP